MIRFYSLDCQQFLARDVPLPSGTDLRLWSPSADGFPSSGPRRVQNVAWWLLCKLGFFARQDFTELTIWRDDILVHRLLITPRWWRFPFMAAEDLQLSNVWTEPAARRQGLSRAAVAAAERLIAASAPRLWYVTHSANLASVRLIESLGYRLAGTGVRTAPLGLRALGRFRLHQQQPSEPRESPTGSRPIARRAGRSRAG